MSFNKNLDIEFKKSKELVNFETALEFMQKRVEEIILGKEKSTIWFLEHEDVYTAGISAKKEDMLNETNIPIFQTNRGGKYTYHGPKMQIIYVMLNLKDLFYPNPPDVAKFVVFLENWVIAILAKFSIKGEIRKGRVGIWVIDKNGNEKKISAIGIKLKKWVSYHGISVNIDPNLKAFDNIVPCGIKEFGITSIKEILGEDINDEKFIEIAKECFFEVLKSPSTTSLKIGE